MALNNQSYYKNGNFFTQWLRTLSIRNKFSVIIGVIIFILLLELLNVWFSLKLMSGIRAWVAAEDYWTKQQKNAHYILDRYARTRDESLYVQIPGFLDAYSGDHAARLEMEKPHPDYELARQHFIDGGIKPGDSHDAVFLFHWFRHIYWVDKAVEYWTGGDAKIEEFIGVSQQLHQAIMTPDAEGRDAVIAGLIEKNNTLDAQVTVLENSFAEVLGEGSRAIKLILFVGAIILNLTLGFLAVFISVLITRISIEVDNAKNEFVSLASHQLRTPATAVKWYSGILLKNRESRMDEKEKKYLGEIYHGNERMIGLIDSLLSITHIEMGKFKFNIRSVDVKALLERLLVEQQGEITRKNQRVAINHLGGAAEIMTDPELLAMILQNLVSNAVKYTRENGHIVCVVEVTNSKLSFQIHDDGIGIPKEEQKYIFAKLFRAKNAIDQNTEGNGLGLYIAFGVARALGGRLWFDSEMGKGTTFYLELPLRLPKP